MSSDSSSLLKSHHCSTFTIKMAIEMTCPHCGRPYKFGDDKAGKKFRCKKCEKPVTVPESDPWAEDFSEDFSDIESGPAARPTRRKSASPKKRKKKRRQEYDGGVAIDTLVPAIFLYLCAFASIFFQAWGLVGSLAGPPPRPRNPNIDPQTLQMYIYLGMAISSFVWIGGGLVVAAGAYNLHRHFSRGWAMTGAILACIPVCGPLLGLSLPFGIWALIVMNLKDVRSRFD
ncbi:hypothetical protein [Stratiformator vulcanicus]|uniref:Uncharacterized protein n=1 Tax=Stratiformator vulcanicus TaxID=2527980 RepID=A0A517R2A3_9PLAN|nr:hypothetical protein [Stratiformator vulcanicus]QDT38015.1 hypothetical protein Pan189_23990 [Stratiformator vulcanicus]